MSKVLVERGAHPGTQDIHGNEKWPTVALSLSCEMVSPWGMLKIINKPKKSQTLASRDIYLV